jgi:outer membrane protein OmpA-like peptidoglycan-associated protein
MPGAVIRIIKGNLLHQVRIFIPLLVMIFCTEVSFSQSEELHTVYFKKNQFNIEEKYKIKLKQLAHKIKVDSCDYIKIFGYADTSGLENYNSMLSKKRAYSVYNFLLSDNRYDTSKVYIQWLGESGEVYDLHLKGAHIQQRSVDVLVQFKKADKAEQ